MTTASELRNGVREASHHLDATVSTLPFGTNDRNQNTQPLLSREARVLQYPSIQNGCLLQSSVVNVVLSSFSDEFLKPPAADFGEVQAALGVEGEHVG